MDDNKDGKLDVTKVLLPKIKNYIAKSIAHEIADVQPIEGPIGEIFKLRHRPLDLKDYMDEWLETINKI